MVVVVGLFGWCGAVCVWMRERKKEMDGWRGDICTLETRLGRGQGWAGCVTSDNEAEAGTGATVTMVTMRHREAEAAGTTVTKAACLRGPCSARLPVYQTKTKQPAKGGCSLGRAVIGRAS